MLTDPGPHLRRYVLEAPIAQVLVNQPRILERLAEVVLIHFRVNVAIHLNNVRPAVIIVVNESAAPRYVPVVNSNTGSECDITEATVTIVVIQVAGVIDKVSFEDIKPAIAIVISHGYTHARLLMTVVIVGATGHYSDVCKRAVMVVLEEDAGFRIDRYIDVGPTIVIEVVRNWGDGKSRPRL